jgi:iron(III) transport system ATP-binding protein
VSGELDVASPASLASPASVASSGGELDVAGLSKSFGRHQVLAGVDLTVRVGSFTAILGPSGSGKTTLLRVLAGFDRPDTGRIEIGGRVVDDSTAGGRQGRHVARHVASEHRHIGYVPQEGGLFPHLTVEANIRFGLPRAQRRAPLDDLVALVGLGDLLRRYPHQLSGGQQQRVALARALAIQPRLVLMDEPFSSLDAALRASVREDVRRVLSEAGTTALLVTHDQDEALSLADQVAVLRAGRIVQCGTPDELYTRPVDAELARFVGDANLCRGVLRDGEVLTPLGALRLVDGVAGALGGASEVVVLIRPEQVVVSVSSDRLAGGPSSVGPRSGEPRLAGSAGSAGSAESAGSAGSGLAGRVTQTDFHGHDTVIAVSAAGTTIHARLAGGAPMAAGTEVSLVASGTVMAWPVAGADGAAVAPPLEGARA